MNRILPSVLLGILVAACGGGSDGAASSAAPAGSSSASDGGANPVTGDSGAPQGDAACVKGASDLPDDNGTDTNCDGADGVVGVDVYVDGASGLDTNLGTPSSPLKTIDQALTLAAQRSGHVLVSSGTYALDAIGAITEWSVYGGYSRSFTGAPKREVTVFLVTENGLSIAASPHAYLAHLTVSAADASKSTQPSSYGIRSSAALLELDDVVVKAGDGLAGAAGKAGTAGAAGATGMAACDGVARPSYAAGAQRGFASAEGASPGSLSPLTPPQSASSGTGGTDGTDATSDLALKDGFLTVSAGTAGGVGSAGYGGAGGASGSYGYSTTIPSGPDANCALLGGDGGAGGCPGRGGDGGVSGGHSIAILVLEGKVAVTRSSLTTGLGGRGGDGGTGGSGGFGEPGHIPSVSTAPMCPSVPVTVAQGTICEKQTDDDHLMQLHCAAFGARGGSGGGGGHGGGGAGGASVGIVIAAGANANVDAATAITEGRAGDGGFGASSQRAASGKHAGQVTLK